MEDKVDEDKDCLSAGELESLLQEAGTSSGSNVCQTTPEPGCAAPPSGQPLVQPGDFSVERLAGLRKHFERFASRLQAELSSLLRTELHVHLSDLDDSTYAEFILRMDNPTCLQILRSSAVERKGFLELHPTVLFPLMDRMLGGGSRPSQIVRRPLTDIELRLVTRLTSRILNVFAETSDTHEPLQFSSERVETDPKRQRYAPADDPLVTVQLQIEMSHGSGPIRLGVPAEVMQTKEAGNDHAADASPIQHPIPSAMAGAKPPGPEDPVALSVVVARTTKPLDEIDSIKIGDVLITEVPSGQPAEVLIDGQKHYLAAIGNQADYKAVQILNPAERVRPAS